MPYRTIAQRVGCIDKKTKEECAPEGPNASQYNCNWSQKRGCISRPHVAHGRIYRSRDADDFETVEIKDGDSISADRKASSAGKGFSKPASATQNKPAATTTGRRANMDGAPKRPADMTSICATFEKNDKKCLEYAPLCKVTKRGCVYNPNAKVTSQTKMPKNLFSKEYISGSPQRLGKTPYSAGYDEFLGDLEEEESPKKPEEEEEFGFGFETANEEDQVQEQEQEQDDQPKFMTHLYFQSPELATAFAKATKLEYKGFQVRAFFTSSGERNALVNKASKAKGFLTEKNMDLK